MTAITISRQLGSMGCEVAEAVAEALGYRVVWRDLINQAARRAGVPGVALHAIDELGLLGYRPSNEEQQAYHQALRQVMLELAEEGKVVIIGRAGQVILKGRTDVLHVRVIAPLEVRAGRLVELHHISLEAARAQIEASDRSRKTFLRRYYKFDWDSQDLYDLIINTDRLSPQAAAGLICELVSHPVRPVSEPYPLDSCIE